MFRRVLLLGIVLAGLLAGTAQAAGVYVAKAPGRVLFERSPHLLTIKGKIWLPAGLEAPLKAAQAYWGIEYPSRCFDGELVYGSPSSEVGEEMAATATPTQRPGENCEMTISPSLTPEAQCRAVVHEFGHWRGFGHTTNPADVMYEGGPWWAVVPECSGS